MIFDLPDLLLEIIQSFLTPRSIYTVSERVHTVKSEWNFFDKDPHEGNKAWRNLMNTTKQLTEIKRKTIYLALKAEFSLSYLESTFFQQKVDRLLHNRREQLQISGKYSDFYFSSASWDGCNKISLTGFEVPIDLSTISNVKCLQLNNCSRNGTIYNMNNLEILILLKCDFIEIIGNCPRLTRLSVNSCYNLRDISKLTNLMSLHVRRCPHLRVHEKTLQTVQFLWLGDETAPTFPSHNINCFKNLKHLSIMDKNVVLDEIWQLDQLHYLKFDKCNIIKVTRFPKNLKALELTISNDSPPVDLSSMPKLNTLLFVQSNITKQVISFLQPLKSLTFENCHCLTDIYLHSTVKEIIMDENANDNRSYSIGDNCRKITLWIGRGISIPKLTLKVNAKFSWQRM